MWGVATMAIFLLLDPPEPDRVEGFRQETLKLCDLFLGGKRGVRQIGLFVGSLGVLAERGFLGEVTHPELRRLPGKMADLISEFSMAAGTSGECLSKCLSDVVHSVGWVVENGVLESKNEQLNFLRKDVFPLARVFDKLEAREEADVMRCAERSFDHCFPHAKVGTFQW